MFKVENFKALRYKMPENGIWLAYPYKNLYPDINPFPCESATYLEYKEECLKFLSDYEIEKLIEKKNSSTMYTIVCWNIAHGKALIDALEILEKKIDTSSDFLSLTPCQIKGIQLYREFLLGSERFLLLTGGGGVGKSYLMSLMINEVEGKAIILSPKHKIKKLHKDKDLILNETYQSFFKIFPNYKKIDNKGNATYEIKNLDRTLENIATYTQECRVIFFEECSMIDSLIYEYIKELIPEQIKIVFVGDSAQIPPIGEDISPTIKETKIKIELKTVVRYSGELLKFCNKIREEILTDSSTFSFHQRKNNNSMVEKLRNSTEALSIFEKKYKQGVDIRILCFKNESMESYNNLLNELLFEEQIENSIYFVGQKVIHNFQSKFFTPRFRPEIITTAKTSYLKNVSNLQKFDEILIQESEVFSDSLYSSTFNDVPEDYFIKSFYLNSDIEKLGGLNRFKKLLETSLEYYFLTGTLENGQEIEIRTLHQDSYEEYFDLIDSLSRQKMYNLKNFLLMLNDWIQPSLSLTIDQSQGSTYEEIILILEGIENKEQINRYYVGISRGKNKVYLV